MVVSSSGHNLCLIAWICAGCLLTANAFAPTNIPSQRYVGRTMKKAPLSVIPGVEELTSSVLIAEDKDYGELFKTAAIVIILGGGLIPATISANSAMMKTLSGRKDAAAEVDPSSIKPGESFDPTIMETKYRKYVEDSGAKGSFAYKVGIVCLIFETTHIPYFSNRPGFAVFVAAVCLRKNTPG